VSAITALAAALASTAFAALRLVGFVATGELLRRRERPPLIAVPLAILVGAALTAFMYALLLSHGQLRLALGADAVLLALSLALRGKSAVKLLRSLLAELGLTLGRNRVAWAMASVIALLYWIQAATPPRDTDSLRYHLAHISQIDAEGAWVALPIVHYAFPFGWQMTYLPFVHLGLPEATQLLNVGLALVVVAALVAWTRRVGTAPGSSARIGATALLAFAAVLLQPLVLTTATNAAADEYAVLGVLAAGLLLVTADRSQLADMRALGFVAWIGMQSRYQAAAIGLAATLVVLLWCLRARGPWKGLFAFAQGGALALLLAAPWYAMNWSESGNPVWPLHTFGTVGATYVERVGSSFTRIWSGHRTPVQWMRSSMALVVDPLAFPLPLLVAAAAVAGMVSGTIRRLVTGARSLSLLAVAYLFVWAFAQPMLYPRFIIYLLPVALMIALPVMAWRAIVAPFERGLRVALAVALAIFLAYAFASAALPAAYLATGNAARLHRLTWYYPVYTWANAHTPRDARFLVIVGSAETYHLDRAYRRADPATSAVVDWQALTDVAALEKVLSDGRYDYLIYEPGDWSGSPGGAHMMQLLDEARQRGILRDDATFRLELTRSRFRHRVFSTTVVVLKVSGEA
jgi:hypothetical protein